MNSNHTHRRGPGQAYPQEICHRLKSGEILNLQGNQPTLLTVDGQENILNSEPDACLSYSGTDSSELASPGPGWVGHGSWTNETSKPILYYQGTWVVPEPPETDGGQAIFLTMGLQPASRARSMFGTVLQWGSGASGGSNSWGLSCWFQNESLRTYSPLLTVKPGDRIDACVQRAIHNAYGSEWRCSARVRGSIEDETLLPIQATLEFSWAFAAFEAYSSAFTCQQAPSSREARFENLVLRSGETPLAPDWQGIVDFDGCGTRVAVESSSEIRIYFRKE